MTLVTAMAWFFLVSAFCTITNAAIIFEYAGNLDLNDNQHGQPRPVSVNVDNTTGEIVISDAAGSALHVMHHGGGVEFVTSTIAGLSNPMDAALTADGGFVFLDTNENQERTIRRLDLVGEPLPYLAASPAKGWRPQHLTVTSDGHFLTLDTMTGLLVKHDAATGDILWSRKLWQSKSSDLICGRPSEAPDGRLYIPVSQEHRIQVLTAEGDQIESFGVVGSTPGKFSFPVDVAFGPHDTVLVLDRMRHLIMVFDQDNKFISEYGRMGAAPGAFYHPVSLAYASGRAYVAQGFEGRVQVYDVLSTEADVRGR